MPRGGDPSAKLKLLRRNPKLETLIIAVPGVGTKPPEEWTDRAGNLWLASIQPDTAPGIGLFAYYHDISRSNDRIWEELPSNGESLLVSLVKLVESEKAIRLACERHEKAFRSFLHLLAGAILMGTPHSTSEADQKWQNVALLPYVGGGLVLKSPSMKLDDIKKLTKISMNFDQSTALCPILTISESVETKISHGFTSKRLLENVSPQFRAVTTYRCLLTSTLKLVDSKFAKTGNRDERNIEVAASHNNLCNEWNEPDTLDFIDECLEDTRLHIVRGSPASVSVRDQWSEADRDEPPPYANTNNSSDSTSNLTYEGGLLTPMATAGTSDLGSEITAVVPEEKVVLGVPLLPCHNIPIARNKDFFGRTDVLDTLDQFFFSPQTGDKSESRSLAICGPGGIGKTQIVAEYVHRCRERNRFDAIFWIYADDSSKLADGLGRISVNLGLVAEDSIDALDHVIAGNLSRGWLSNPVKKLNGNEEELGNLASWLVVLDNLDDLSICEEIWPLDGPGCILITSRDPLAKESHVLASFGIDLKPFDWEEASRMLETLTNKKGNSRAVAERLGGFPLAITQMASIMIRNHLSFSEFAEAWDEKETHDEFIGLSLGERRTGADMYRKSLSTVWAMEDLQHGRDLLDVIAFFDPDAIAEQMLKSRKPLQLGQYPTTLAAFQKSRTELLQTSLISRDDATQTVTVHRVVQDVTISKMTSSQYVNAYSTALSLACHVWPFEAFGWRHNTARWRMCEGLLPHVVRLKSLEAEFARSSASLSSRIDYCRLMNDAGW
ncbi:MAG: hypothetical protein M1820_001504 [Bogoriella megaspora]|nr:MAG: hypothetical protein M1820_001504 [Bogoriella megaspora]